MICTDKRCRVLTKTKYDEKIVVDDESRDREVSSSKLFVNNSCCLVRRLLLVLIS